MHLCLESAVYYERILPRDVTSEFNRDCLACLSEFLLLCFFILCYLLNIVPDKAGLPFDEGDSTVLKGFFKTC